ncbi:DEAD/DEAH box helicase family protein [Enterococcus devriesei]|uniref:Competence protein ComFA n=1 Tax=Enterococcus devriesei TaxID=319970 RepID=A0A1L8SUK9_9ENTE|nr:DEAD/DEAH box helicase family protein [Enterococcus devriesei]OJG35741.1 hypothetical protein RV00_GL002495 [Enterococcus devriesei]
MAITGQRLLRQEWQVFYPDVDLNQARKIPAMNAVGERWFCQRCGNLSQAALPAGFFYCPVCLALGRITSHSFLYYFPVKELSARKVVLAWSGVFSAAQEKIARRLVTDQPIGKTFLLWAVTGAGKTEILFPLIKAVLEKGQRVVLTSPRVDVCNELYLRFRQAFPKEKISLFHGQERKDAGDTFVICTVHQLLRYQDSFDLVIVDEVDAFPYSTDPLLPQAVERAQREKAKRIYLSATPDQKLRQAVDCRYYLPARYHRRPLVLPEVLWTLNLEKSLNRGHLNKKMLRRILLLLTKNHVLLFCPSIQLLAKIESYFKANLADSRLTTVFSKDKERLVKVENMREGRYDLLLTTTILERGVTFENISVVVLQASHRVFNQAALVQIAGRADRKGAYSEAEVVFVTSEMTRDIKTAIKEIRNHNQRALQEGLIDAL